MAFGESITKKIAEGNKAMQYISMKTKEIINTVELLSKYALERLKKLKREYLEIIKNKKFEKTKNFINLSQNQNSMSI